MCIITYGKCIFNNGIYNIFKTNWDKVPKLLANGIGPHFLLRRGLFKSTTDYIKKNINAKVTPLYKLSYKYESVPYDKNINVYYLYDTLLK